MELDCSPNCLSKLSGGSCVSLITWISRVTILKLKKTLQRFATYICVPALTGKSSSRSRNMAIDNPGRDVCRTTDTISIRLHIYWHFLASMRNRILLTDSFFRTLTVKTITTQQSLSARSSTNPSAHSWELCGNPHLANRLQEVKSSSPVGPVMIQHTISLMKLYRALSEIIATPKTPYSPIYIMPDEILRRVFLVPRLLLCIRIRNLRSFKLTEPDWSLKYCKG